MGGFNSYIAMLSLCAFLSTVWVASKFSRIAGVSPIILEFAVGLALGPQAGNLISPEYSLCERRRQTECEVVDLGLRLRQGLPIGPELARIADTQACSRGVYGYTSVGLDIDIVYPTNEEEEEVEEAEEVVDDGTDGTFQSFDGNATYEDDDEHELGNFTESGMGDPFFGQEDPTGDGGKQAMQALQARENLRRLAYGGPAAKYGSYEECLVNTCKEEVSRDCHGMPDIFTLIGYAGVSLAMFETGMHFTFDKATNLSPKAWGSATVGAVLPFVTGSLLTALYGKTGVPDCIAVGAAMVPSSIGMAMRGLREVGALEEDVSQTVLGAAFVDQVLSLLIFDVVWNLRHGFDGIKVILFPIVGVIFTCLITFLSAKVWPTLMDEWITDNLPSKRSEGGMPSVDEALLAIMFAALVGFAAFTHVLGTHLWGCFVGGILFSSVQPLTHPNRVWLRHTKRLTNWMVRIFFACTIAFAVPVSTFLTWNAVWKGFIMGLGPCVLCKAFCASHAGNQKIAVGWALVGRSEFAYFIAQVTASAGMIDDETFSISIWALLCGTLAGPLLFRTSLRRHLQQGPAKADKSGAGNPPEKALWQERSGAPPPSWAHQPEVDPQRRPAPPDGAAPPLAPAEPEQRPAKPKRGMSLRDSASAGSRAIDERTEVKVNVEGCDAAEEQGRRREPYTQRSQRLLCCVFQNSARNSKG